MAHRFKLRFMSSLVPLLPILAGVAVICTGSIATGASNTGAASTTYVGSKPCAICHAKVYEQWTSSTHGKNLLSDSLSENIRGCEACHGAGSAHVGSGGQNKPVVPSADNPTAVNATCRICHFKSDSSPAPKDWQNLSPKDWAGSMHGRKGLSCLSCHTGHPNGNDKALIKPAKDLCITCHSAVLEKSPGQTAAYTHSPVAQGKCLTCHDPHGSTDQHMTIANVDSTCATCHNVSDPKILTAHQNYPIAGSKCTSCHDPHSHDAAGKLISAKQHMPFKKGMCSTCHTAPEAGKPVGLSKAVNELCFSCHPSSTLMPEGEKAHLPAQQGMCVACHNPHASRENALLKTKLADNCFACHTKVQDSTLKAHKHKILEANMNCMLCHKPHSAPKDSLLTKDQSELCGQCHKHTFSHPLGKRADGTIVLDPRTKKQMVCTSCHEVHGSDFETLTTGEKKRELCLKCHNVDHQGEEH